MGMQRFSHKCMRAAFAYQALDLEIEAATSRAQESAARVAELQDKIQLQDLALADVQEKVHKPFLGTQYHHSYSPVARTWLHAPKEP